MHSFIRWLSGALLVIGMLTGQTAFAQKVLLLTTNVTAPDPENADAITAYVNLESEFASTVGPSNITRLSVLGTANAISQATFSNGGVPYDIVIVAGTYRPIDNTNWAVIQSAVQNRWANAIVFFVDGCCEAGNGGNARKMVTALNAGAAAGFTLGSSQSGPGSFPLNTLSPFASSFAGLNPFVGGDITYINSVPASNALYLAAGTVPANFPAPGAGLVNDVYGLLIPTAQSNAGKGACVFAVVDVSPFAPGWAANRTKVAPAFVNAATSANGACGLPKVSKTFDKTELTLGGSDNNAVLSIQLSNGTPSPMPGVNLTDNLPAPLLVGAGASTNTCTGTLNAAPGANAVSMTGFAIPAGGCTITVPVTWPNTDAGRQACVTTPTVTNTITPGVDFVAPTGQVTTPATAALTCRAGQLNVSKQVIRPLNLSAIDLTGASFPMEVACTGSDGIALPPINTAVTLSSATTGSVVVTPVISSGSCTVTETSRPAPPTNFAWIENPPPSATAALSAPPAAPTVLITNTLARANADLTIQKNVSGGPASGPQGVFNFTANCGADGNFTAAVTLTSSPVGAIAIRNVPEGASCTVSEDAALPAAPAGYAWSTTMPPPVTLVTTNTGNVASFVNTLIQTSPATPAPVPALDNWKLLLLMFGMAIWGVLALQRKPRG